MIPADDIAYLFFSQIIISLKALSLNKRLKNGKCHTKNYNPRYISSGGDLFNCIVISITLEFTAFIKFILTKFYVDIGLSFRKIYVNANAIRVVDIHRVICGAPHAEGVSMSQTLRLGSCCVSREAPSQSVHHSI